MADPGEARVSQIIGGRPSPGSGRRGHDGDQLLKGTIFEGAWILETKRRPRLPRHVYNAYRQAQVAVAIGDQRTPAAVLVPDDPTEPVLFVAALIDVKAFCEALSEMGQGAKVRSLVRQARRALDEIDGCAR